MTSKVSYAGKNIKWNTAEDAKHVATDLEEFENLKNLELEGNTLGVEAAKVIGDALANHPEFERALWKDLFTGRLKTEIPQALKHLFSGVMKANAKLVELDLSDNALGPIGVEGMVEFIKSPSCYSLQELRLNNNGLGVRGGTMLAEALIELVENSRKAGTHLKLKVFISGRNRLENKGAKMFAKFFSRVKSLEEIAMPQNGIFHEGIAALAKAFSLNPNLKVINLNDNTFTPKGAKAMAEELPKMANLEVINFGDCLIKSDGAFSVSRAIKETHTKLRELYLDSNEIKIDGGLALVEAVANKPNISHLMLDTNQFGEEGAERIMKALKEMGKEGVLGSLEENEEPDDEESEKEDVEDEEEEEQEEEEDEDDAESQKGISPFRRDSTIEAAKCTAAEFLADPSASRLLGLTDPVASLLAEAKSRAGNPSREPEFGSSESSEALIHEFVHIYMTVASFATSSNPKVTEIVQNATKEIGKEIFDEAEKKQLMSVATNCFLVHMGLLKSESKKFRLNEDLRGGIISLTKTVREAYFPSSVKNTLQFFFSRPGLRIDAYQQEKHKLLSSLFAL